MLQAVDKILTLPRPEAESFIRPATVVEVGGGTLYRLSLGDRPGESELWAYPAVAGADRLGPGDRVLAAGESTGACYIIGILESRPAPRRVTSREGASARLVETDGGERIEVRDAEDRLIFDYRPDAGRAVLSMPAGDLALSAPNGNIDLVSGKAIRARAGEAVALEGPKLRVAGERGEFLIGEATYRGRRLSATVETAKVVLDRLETVASRLVERAKNVYRHVENLNQIKAGRMRSLVQGAHHQKAGRMSIKADDDVKVDGRRIHLG